MGKGAERMRAENVNALYTECRLCPRDCGVDRSEDERGYCGQGARARIAWAGLHRGEEPPLVGTQGSGTVFFSGCTLKCGSCQNCQISHQGLGREVSLGQLSELMLKLQGRGSANINLVTASHFTPSVIAAAASARKRGLSIPVVWNSSGYERMSTLDLLEETVDVYLPDCKTLDPQVSRRLMGAADYPEAVRAAVSKMVRDRPLDFEEQHLRRGVIVRHLVLPGLLDSSRGVLEWFARRLKGRALLSLMFQYTPVSPEARLQEIEPQQGPRRTVSRREYDRVLSWLEEMDIEDGFIQEPACNDDWLPDFTRRNPFPDGQAVPIWHYRSGYVD